MKIDSQDNQTILAYFTARHRAAGYKGFCAINTKRLAELHLESSIEIANDAIAKMRGLS